MHIVERRSAADGEAKAQQDDIIRTGVEYQRPVPVGWQEELDAICPPSDYYPRFLLRWEAGERWDPVGRWIIWNLQPRRITHNPKANVFYQAIIAECEGPHPRTTGHYCAPGQCGCEFKKNAWRGGTAKLIDRDTWDVYQQTGRYGRRWWVIQGAVGGHRYRLAAWEQQIWKVVTGMPDVPTVGDLPYAPWDNRVKRHLVGLERTMRWLGVVKYGEKNRHNLDADEKAEVELAKQAVGNWMAQQMDGIWDEYGGLLRRHARDLGSGAYVHDPYFNPDEVAGEYHLS